MLPDTYKDYAGIFDLFSNQQLTPQLAKFCADLFPRVPDKAAVCDVGAGTGYWTEKLLEQKHDLRLTVVEPSPEMLAIARKRLAAYGASVVYRDELFDDVLPSLPVQDVVIFQRSLYCLYGSLERYKKLAADLAVKISPGGLLAICEIAGKYDIPYFEYYCLKNLPLYGLSPEEFRQKWPIMEKVMAEFNRNVDAGRFTLFDAAKIAEVFAPAGFRLESGGEGSYFLKRKS